MNNGNIIPQHKSVSCFCWHRQQQNTVNINQGGCTTIWRESRVELRHRKPQVMTSDDIKNGLVQWNGSMVLRLLAPQ